MTWFKIDDALHSHRKAVRAGISAMGLWVMAGSWCADHLSNGFIPDYMAARLDRDYEQNAGRLVDAGLWEPAERGGDKGWQFHEWTDHQPTREEVQAAAAKKSSGGKLGNHRRWHTEKGKSDPHCPFCADIPSQRDRITDRSTDGASDRIQESVATPPTRPDPTRPELPTGVQNPAASATAEQPALSGMPEPPPLPEREYSPADMAFGVARWRIEERQKANTPIIGGGRHGPVHALKNVLVDAFVANYTEDEVKQALAGIEDGIPSKQQINRALSRLRNPNQTQPAGHNGAGYQSTRHTPFRNPETIDAYHGDL